MKPRAASHWIIPSILLLAVLILLYLELHIRMEDRKLAALLPQFFKVNPGPQSQQKVRLASPWFKPSPLLDAPISDKTALSFFWFGDMESHFRDPINFYAVPGADSRLHKVSLANGEMRDDQVDVFISAAEMERLLEGLKSLGLHWDDSKDREVFRDTHHRRDNGFLDITFVSSNATAKSHIRIARMCTQLDHLDSLMPTPRILWQFRTFRWDNGCEISGYDNQAMPSE
ncbi:MAG: hypothetical protein P4L03_05820 [Terracidiphilus sp.]|nr:hypothetical protein [Terracidiphilus sp.]